MYCAAMMVVYVVGMPVGVLALLRRHRRTLFGPASDSTQRRLGYLYAVYVLVCIHAW